MVSIDASLSLFSSFRLLLAIITLKKKNVQFGSSYIGSNYCKYSPYSHIKSDFNNLQQLFICVNYIEWTTITRIRFSQGKDFCTIFGLSLPLAGYQQLVARQHYLKVQFCIEHTRKNCLTSTNLKVERNLELTDFKTSGIWLE